MARSYFCWSSLDKAVEELVRSCSACQAIQAAPCSCSPASLDVARCTFNVDFAGPFSGNMCFIVVGAQSEWLEGIIMSSTTAQHTIEALWPHYGLPEQLVSDNGQQFTSQEFAKFMKRNGIKHIFCSPYHPSSNCIAEWFVQTFKWAMRTGKDGTSCLSKFLFSYHSTAHATTAVCQSQLFLRRKLRTRFKLLKPNTRGVVVSRQATQRVQHDKHSKLQSLFIESPVMVGVFRQPSKWIPGIVLVQ